MVLPEVYYSYGRTNVTNYLGFLITSRISTTYHFRDFKSRVLPTISNPWYSLGFKTPILSGGFNTRYYHQHQCLLWHWIVSYMLKT